jgi:hypothetical protein
MNASAPFLPGAGRYNSRLALSAVLALTLILVPALGASVARAADTPLDFSAGDQYVETLPTAKGPQATDSSPRRRPSSGLSGRTKRQLKSEGGGEAATLQYVASSPEVGAPPSIVSGSGQSGSGDSGNSKGAHRGAGGGSPSVPSAAINAAGGSGSGLGWLALALPLITALALGAFGFQRRRNRDSG